MHPVNIIHYQFDGWRFSAGMRVFASLFRLPPPSTNHQSTPMLFAPTDGVLGNLTN